ncbi:MAG: hypothetical protein OXQ29_01300, partial [Rhodospirillaceae bacterium]|nr:hypothetical protein [Rhodospirillaceae bacterium]
HHKVHDIIGYGYHDREPLVPFVIAAIDITRRALGHEPVPLVCVASNTAAPECALTYTLYKFLHIVFLLVAAVGAFFIVLWFTGTKWLAYATFLLTTQSTELLHSIDINSFYTEVPAAALMVATSAFSLLALTRRRAVYSVLLGLALAALVLTKTIFVYLWIIIALIFVVSDLSKKRFDQSSVALVSLFLVAHFIPLGTWMARNYA